MFLIVCSLCSNDGTLFIPSYKSTLMNSMADMNHLLNYELPFIIPLKVQKTLIIDMMAVLQSMKKWLELKLCQISLVLFASIY